MTFEDCAAAASCCGELRLYTAFVAVEYDFQVMARSEAEALELAKQNWLQSRANVAIAHAEVELAPALEQPPEGAPDEL